MSWEAVLAQRAFLKKMGALLFGLALVAAIAGFFSPSIGSLPVILALLAMQTFGAVPLLQRIADLQAVLDMRKTHEDAGAPAGTITIRPGEIHEFKGLMNNSLKLRAHTTSKLEVLP